MSDLSWIAPTVASLSAMVVAIISAMRSRDNGAKMDTVLEKAAEIHAATNGTLHQITSNRDVLLQKVEGLEAALATLQKSGTLAAATAAQAATDVREAAASTPPHDANQ
jgi:ribosomal 50S subunit-associated protein YjgA (DUF615 family)